jgi:hypothetical protein
MERDRRTTGFVCPLDRASIRHALDNPEPYIPRQTRAAGQHGEPRSKACVCRCGNPDCPHNAELDVSSFPDDVTYGDLQPGCSAPCAIVAAPTSEISRTHRRKAVGQNIFRPTVVFEAGYRSHD